MKKFVSNSPEESRKFARDFAEKILATPMSRRNLAIGALVLHQDVKDIKEFIKIAAKI